MQCPICQKKYTQKANKTCGDTSCVVRMSRQTAEATELQDQLRHMREAYGDENPWTQWLKRQLVKEVT